MRPISDERAKELRANQAIGPTVLPGICHWFSGFQGQRLAGAFYGPDNRLRYILLGRNENGDYQPLARGDDYPNYRAVRAAINQKMYELRLT